MYVEEKKKMYIFMYEIKKKVLEKKRRYKCLVI